jgi:bifunctional DNase/RNase
MPRPMTYQLAANLLAATQSQVTDVRITELTESTFYAVVVVHTPTGPMEVDARPSDALNLAVVSDAPINVAALLLDDPAATRHTAWQQFPTHSPELAAEVRDRHAELRANLTQEHQDELDA